MSLVRAIIGRGGLLLVLSSLGLAIGCGGKVDLKFTGSSNNAGGEGPTKAVCGNRVVEDGEGCDDGAQKDGDGCDGSCQVEDGWTCTGAPSMCVKCGNGTLEAGEECDDGNGDDGDGCSAMCKIEGTCDMPSPITLKTDKDGLVGTVNSATNKGEPGLVDAAECPAGGASVGAGPDRVFSFELPSDADLDVSVSGNFDTVLRLISVGKGSACDLTQAAGVGCADDGAVNEAEQIHIDHAAAGRYAVIVDGKTAQQAGNFSVNVEARCPLDGLKIARIILADPFRTVLFNTNQTCGIDLSRVGVTAQPEAPDAPAMLPAITLDPLTKRILTSESPPPNGMSFQGKIPFDVSSYSGAYYLCRGQCAKPSGSNVFDAVRWSGDAGKPKIPALATVNFDANVGAITDRTLMSLWRVGYDGKAPNFLAADYVPAYFVETFDDGQLLNWDPPAPVFYKTKLLSVPGTLGAFSLELDGGNATDTVWNGLKHSFFDNSGTKVPLTPASVSIRVRGSDKTLNYGWAFFGNPGMGPEESGFGSVFKVNGTLAIQSSPGPNVNPTPTFSSQYTANTWYTLEYRPDFVAGTVAVYENDKLQTNGAVMAMPFTAKSISEINLKSVSKATVWFDQIIVR